MQLVEHLTQKQVLTIMSRVKFFKRFSTADCLLMLDKSTQLIACREGEWVLMQDDEKDRALYVLLTGELEVWKDDIRVGDIKPGHCFGEVSFLTKNARTSSIKCLTNAVVFRLQRKALTEFPIHIREKIKDNIIMLLLDRVKQGSQFREPAAVPPGESPFVEQGDHGDTESSAAPENVWDSLDDDLGMAEDI
ncbi:cyclic nucleotide-binding domain-containing protein [Salinispirillum sp. LH 10-3-1]|uniref:Cyclic nucleotide-binding domain-containing protein n=1 Tax=Salinispirillum sp. LH 10-3-1 TaxID=2952525 RepID=A0AB38YDG9_9GAMM